MEGKRADINPSKLQRNVMITSYWCGKHEERENVAKVTRRGKKRRSQRSSSFNTLSSAANSTAKRLNTHAKKINGRQRESV